MQYLGGKSTTAKLLCAAINPIRRGRMVWDAFCGGLSMSVELAKRGPVITSDANPALISLYQAVAAGWDPPASVTEEQYKAGRTLPDSDPMKAFLGFGCSFGGKWFGGFARSKDPKDGRSVRGYASQARNGLLEDIPAILKADGTILNLDYLSLSLSGQESKRLRSERHHPVFGPTVSGHNRLRRDREIRSHTLLRASSAVVRANGRLRE